MKVIIKYCGQWGYEARAQGVSDEILKAYPDAEVKLEVGFGGQFDIIYESDPPALLFSKKSYHPPRFPEGNEIVEKLQENKNG